MRQLSSISCLGGNTDQQLSRLLEHVPRGDERRPAGNQLVVGKGTVTLEDFDHCDGGCFAIGHNPGTNHPRMLTTLREVSKARSADYRAQPAPRARSGAVYVAAAPCGDADAQLDADRIDLLPGEGRRRYRSAEGDDEDPHGT